MLSQPLIIFITSHWALVVLFLALLAAIVWYETIGHRGNIESLTPEQAVRFINREHAIVVDVRSRDAFDEKHIIDAKNFSADQVAALDKTLTPYKEKPIILVCEQGQRTLTLAKTLKRAGFEQIYTLGGGIQAWKNAKLPLIT